MKKQIAKMLLYPFAVFMLCASLKTFALEPSIEDRCPIFPTIKEDNICDKLTTPTGYARYDCVKSTNSRCSTIII